MPCPLEPTPTGNPLLAHVPGRFGSIAEALDYAGRGETGVNFYGASGELQQVLSYRTLRERARAAAACLAGMALPPGSVMAMIADTGPDFLVCFYACQYAGLVPCPLPYTVYAGGKDAYVAQLRAMLAGSGAAVLLAPRAILPCAVAAAQALPRVRVLAFEAVDELPIGPLPPASGPAACAYIQHSSGTTSHPRAIEVSQRALCANIEAMLVHGLRLGPRDRACSWLPLFHDMGLVGFAIGAMFGQCSVDFLSPAAFARRPLAWPRLMSDNRATITYAPAFGYRLAARRMHAAPTLDLSSLRVAGVGADMVPPEVLDEFAAAFGPAGFRRQAFLPSYGLAEATLAVSIAAPGSGARVVACPGDASAGGKPLVSCGQPLPGVEVMVADAAGMPVPGGRVGHVWVRGDSIAAGYRNDAAAAAAMRRRDGYIDTGDLGFLAGAELVITGRAKDVLVLRGRSLSAQGVEAVVEAVPPLHAGDAAAFCVAQQDDEDCLVVLVQCGIAEAAARARLRQDVQAALGEAFGLAGRVVLVAPRALPRTSSGKLSRAQARRDYLAGALVETAEPACQETA
ncbi:AMP-binding protein [Cupriavidus sp. MP-37]|uniref:AMP-binding protein n=1 Tax=Cupriavidus sp. MP-37 TaxID=2884455 RepID=UPI001D0A1EB6|nr:AMP-binding protein [Cupriavidus sp. MP-37]UDM48872.1 AMP-binding protein [Cupriavidus sp. MP-37]